jgi:hypothetical protein
MRVFEDPQHLAPYVPWSFDLILYDAVESVAQRSGYRGTTDIGLIAMDFDTGDAGQTQCRVSRAWAAAFA